MTTVRLATFNCENLFARYKFEAGPPGGKKVLKPEELDQRWGFIPPESWKNSFQIFTHDGWRELTALALKGKDGYPHIACVEEIESLPALRRFNKDFLGGHYQHAVLIDGHDPRNIDVGVLSTFPITDLKTHIDEVTTGPGKWLFSRDCLEVTFDVAGTPLYVFVNHLKSQLAKTPQERVAAAARRKVQASRVAAIIQGRFGNAWQNTNLVVVGDFNDQPTSPYVQPLLALGMTNVVDRLPADERWTHFWDKKNLVSQLDYILVTPKLSAASQKPPYVERRGLVKKQNMSVSMAKLDDTPGAPAALPSQRFAGVTNKMSASDHCPVVMELNV